ncbi:cell wall lytic activity [Citricoccus sp. SGAir0253]|nr:cell wall lytic activity [Citricoccus sp. SGAir0253]
MPAQGAPAVRETTSIPAPGLDIERAAAVTAVNVAAAKDVKVELDRASLDSTPAPEPEPEPVVETPAEREPVAEVAAPVAQERTAERPARAAQAERPARAEQPERRAETERPAEAEPVQRASQSTVTEQAAPKPAPESSGTGLSGVVSAAYAGVGVPYVYGGKTTAGWDCSGFVAWAYRQAGITIPSQTSAIRFSGKFVPTSNPKPGDLVYQNGGGHVGIYVGNGMMIGAQNPSVGTFLHPVTRNPLLGYYTYVG